MMQEQSVESRIAHLDKEMAVANTKLDNITEQLRVMNERFVKRDKVDAAQEERIRLLETRLDKSEGAIKIVKWALPLGFLAITALATCLAVFI